MSLVNLLLVKTLLVLAACIFATSDMACRPKADRMGVATCYALVALFVATAASI